MDETIKKIARTAANQFNLLDQYPEYRFIQSAAYHTWLMEQHYPQVFRQLQKRVADGRFELNGAVWVECDCNIPSGESLVRQFLWGTGTSGISSARSSGYSGCRIPLATAPPCHRLCRVLV